MRHLIAAVLVSSAVMLPELAHAEAPFNFAHTPGQLPKTVAPSAYAIDIVTDMTRLTLAGHERITVAAAVATDSITLNQAGLKLSAATLDGMPAVIMQDDRAQTATLRLPRAIAAGRHTLVIDYTGPIPQTPNGIYNDDYSLAGASKRMLVTQFEVGDARRMFPGWDEPAFKATFQLGVTLPRNYLPVSNMPVSSSGPAGLGARRVLFATTPRMSTYLLALVAGDISAFQGAALDSNGSTLISVYAPTGEQQNGAYALHAATDILPYYNSYFGVPYPLPKLDLIAIPGNYEAGAMENWGAITFIDNDLLFDARTSAPNTREEIYLTVAHEMSHQWSGDLVTMGWWDNIWLNEGFATWMETKATDHFNPSWQVWPRQHTDRELAMAVDAKPTTHPMQQAIHDVSEANAAFDLISYQKGEQFIRMIEDWLGPDTFRDGMRVYMKAHAYHNTTSGDLWAALSQVSHQDVAAVATSFTTQPGIPLVDVARACEDGATTLTLTQGRFTIHDPHPAALTWRIPVTVGGPGVEARKLVLGATPARLRFAGCAQALKVNLGENGYYRTRYDAASLSALGRAFARLDATDRADLLGDQFALFEAGQAPLASYLDLIAGLPAEHERSIAVWQDTLSHLQRLDELERGSASRPAFRAFARSLLDPEMARLGWTPRPGEGFLDTLLRPDLITALGTFDDPAVTAEAQRRFAAYREQPGSLPPSLLDPVIRIVGMHADATTYTTLAGLVRSAPDTEQKQRFFTALAASHDSALMARSVRIAYSGAIPNGRIVYDLERIASYSDDPDAVWRLVQPNQAPIRTHLAPWSQDQLLPAIASQSANPAIARVLLTDPASHASGGARIETAKAEDVIATNAEVRDRAQPAIASWLEAGAAER